MNEAPKPQLPIGPRQVPQVPSTSLAPAPGLSRLDRSRPSRQEPCIFTPAAAVTGRFKRNFRLVAGAGEPLPRKQSVNPRKLCFQAPSCSSESNQAGQSQSPLPIHSAFEAMIDEQSMDTSPTHTHTNEVADNITGSDTQQLEQTDRITQLAMDDTVLFEQDPVTVTDTPVLVVQVHTSCTAAQISSGDTSISPHTPPEEPTQSPNEVPTSSSSPPQQSTTPQTPLV